jgi:hypothetical protein
MPKIGLIKDCEIRIAAKHIMDIILVILLLTCTLYILSIIYCLFTCLTVYCHCLLFLGPLRWATSLSTIHVPRYSSASQGTLSLFLFSLYSGTIGYCIKASAEFVSFRIHVVVV